MSKYIVNGIEIKKPTSFKTERYHVTTMERLADATMVGDRLARKEKYYFSYAGISAVDFEKILEAVWYTEDLFFDFIYEENGIEHTRSVYVGSIPSELHYAGTNPDAWIWKNVTFNLIER